MDAGAGGVIIPMIESAEQLKKVRDVTRWPPAGKRGVAFSRANLFGKKFDEYIEDAQKPLLVAMIEHINSIDDLDAILKTGIDRSIKQLDPIERNILRIAIYELEKKELEPAIVISEAIRMSKKYGSTDGYKFVNAVLDKLVKEKEGKR